MISSGWFRLDGFICEFGWMVGVLCPLQTCLDEIIEFMMALNIRICIFMA